jgi:hypothetical protein
VKRAAPIKRRRRYRFERPRQRGLGKGRGRKASGSQNPTTLASARARAPAPTASGPQATGERSRRRGSDHRTSEGGTEGTLLPPSRGSRAERGWSGSARRVEPGRPGLMRAKRGGSDAQIGPSLGGGRSEDLPEQARFSPAQAGGLRHPCSHRVNGVVNRVVYRFTARTIPPQQPWLSTEATHDGHCEYNPKAGASWTGALWLSCGGSS